MYRVSRIAPDKPGMPVLGYVTVVGTALLGLVFVADAFMPRNERLSFVSNFYGLPKAYKGQPVYVPAAAPHIAPAVSETTGSGLALSGSEAKRQPSLTAQPASAQPLRQNAVKPAKKKIAQKRQRNDDNGFGSNGFAQQHFGFDSREPSWRDSWASQPREQHRRSVARNNNDFWLFR